MFYVGVVLEKDVINLRFITCLIARVARGGGGSEGNVSYLLPRILYITDVFVHM